MLSQPGCPGPDGASYVSQRVAVFGPAGPIVGQSCCGALRDLESSDIVFVSFFSFGVLDELIVSKECGNKRERDEKDGAHLFLTTRLVD